MAKTLEDLLQEIQKELDTQIYNYLRWLILIAAGAFSLSFKILLDNNIESENLKLVAKLALSFNALGVMAGAIAVAGQIHELSDYKRHLMRLRSLQNRGVDVRPEIEIKWPLWLKIARLSCFATLFLSVAAWFIFIWMA
jgi:predicted histidine transporter YuiF (NhaC family)